MTLPEQLSHLEASGLILLAQLQPEVEYLFRHALVHEAAYHSLVRIDRRRLHRAAGEALESQLAANPGTSDLVPILARHFAEAGDRARALRYYSQAGRAAASIYANREAHEHFSRALELALASADRDAVVELYLRRGRVLELSAQDAAALANYQALEGWAAAHGDPHAQLEALNARSTIYVKPTVEQNFALGRDLSQQALTLARALDDPRAEAKALWNLTQYYQSVAKYPEAREHGEMALALARASGDREQVAYVLTELTKVYFTAEFHSRAWAALAEAREIWRQLGILNMLADNLASTSFFNVLTGNYPEALKWSAEAAQVSRAIGNVWNESYAHYGVDMVHFDQGNIGLALAEAAECLRLAEKAGFSEGLTQTSFNLALVYAYMNDLRHALETGYESQARADALGGAPYSSHGHVALIASLQAQAGDLEAAHATLAAPQLSADRSELKNEFFLSYYFFTAVEGEIALAEGRAQQALPLAEAALGQLQETGLHLFLVDALYLRGRVLHALGRTDAEAALEAARTEAESLGSRRVLWLILAELAALHADRGDPTAALALHQQAAEIIAHIAQHAGSAELAASFLRRPDVQAVLTQARSER